MPSPTETKPSINPKTEPTTGSSPDVRPNIDQPWVVILYNDDIHSFDEVVFQVQKATGFELAAAVTITLAAHLDGRAITYDGTLQDCERVAGVLRQIRLQVETDRAL
jgi:ATP-dependent Clp protease adaptor protein ClpS